MNTPDFEKAAEWLEACADRILHGQQAPKPRLIATIEGEPINTDERKVWWRAKLAIDDDGSVNKWHDRDWQADTTLHYKGKPIDSERIPGIVVPPAIVEGVQPIVFGCQASVEYRRNGVTIKTELAVVFDQGPAHKLGEGTPELARRLGIPDSAVSGGDDLHELYYTIVPGCAAIVAVGDSSKGEEMVETQFDLQPA